MKAHVQLFITCLIDSLFPEVGQAVFDVFSRSGMGVDFPAGQTCCGQPAYNAGFEAEAQHMARSTIEVLDAADGPVVVPSGSCTAMMRHGFLELFKHDPEWRARARRLAGRVFEFSEYLSPSNVVPSGGGYEHGRVVYHASCHLQRGLGVEQQPLDLMQQVLRHAPSSLSSECCGFGGLFSIDHSAISGEMLDKRLAEIEANGASVVTACDVGCLMHIEGGLRKKGSPVRCAHLAQVLAGQEPGLR